MMPLTLVGIAAGLALSTPSVSNRLHTTLHVDKPRAGMVKAWWYVGAALLAALILQLNVTLVVAAGCALATAVHVLRRVKATRRRAMGRKAIASALELMISQYKAGATTADSLERAAREIDHPELATALAVAARQARAGGDSGEALAEASDSIAEVRTLGTTLSAAHEHGIAHVPLLENLQASVDHAVRHAESSASELQGATFTAAILAALPMLGVGMGFAMGVDTVAFLAGGGIGGVLLIVGTAFLCGGVLMSERIITKARTTLS